MKYFIGIVIMFTSIYSFAQNTEFPELIGDRPDQTESAFVLPKGYFQFENGFINEMENTNTKNITYSSMLMRYGLFEHFELRFVTEYSKIKTIGIKDISGFSPISVGAKIHVNEQDAWIPQIAFLGHISIAETGNSEFKQDFHSAQMVLTFNHDINKSWSLGYSIGAELPTEMDYTVGTYTLVSGFGITDRVGAFIEVYGDFSKYMFADNRINGGITYLLQPSLQLDFAGGFGLSKYSANNYFTLGFIYLFKI